VAEVAIVPSPDPVRLGVPKAFLVLTQNAAAGPALAAEIFEFVKTRLAPYKRIRRIQFVTVLPKRSPVRFAG
jgi:acetyl-CoA synthetase